MLNLLAQIFIKNRDNVSDPKVRTAYGMLCGGLGIALNFLLCALKLTAGILGNSVAITADAMNNLSDSGSSLVSLLGFKLAEQKPDPGHPFGHGRIEYISGLIVSFIILMMGSELLKSSIEKIFTPEKTEFQPIIAVILAFSIAVKLYMAFYNAKTAKKIGSAAMKATASDSISDCIATTVVFASMIVSEAWQIQIDGICGAAVSLFVIAAGIKAAKETINPLLGQPPSEEFVSQIKEIVTASEDIVGMHDLVVHDYGPGRRMISLHAEVPEDGDLLRTHDTIDNIEKTLTEKLGCSAVIHMDPIAAHDEQTEQAKTKAAKVLQQEIDPQITLHDFRIVNGPTHTNLIFDLAAPFSLKMTDEEIKKTAEKAIQRENKNWYAVISVDRIYT